MSFDLGSAIRPDLVENFRITWAHIGATGTWWTGPERVAVAAEARAGRAGAPSPGMLSGPAAEAARVLAARPQDARRSWVRSLEERGLGTASYVEIVGVVSRLVATDTFHQGLDLDLEPLPEGFPGEPSRALPAGARAGKGWVPMVGGAGVTTALTLVPAENVEVFRFHGPMYIPPAEMGDMRFSRTLDRPQLELLAARTSALNECFY